MRLARGVKMKLQWIIVLNLCRKYLSLLWKYVQYVNLSFLRTYHWVIDNGFGSYLPWLNGGCAEQTPVFSSSMNVIEGFERFKWRLMWLLILASTCCSLMDILEFISSLWSLIDFQSFLTFTLNKNKLSWVFWGSHWWPSINLRSSLLFLTIRNEFSWRAFFLWCD